MDVVTERQQDILSARVNGRVDGSNASEFEEAIRTAIDKNDKGVLIDFEKLVYISSTGLRVLLMLIRDLLRREIPVAFCTVSEQVRKVITISGFDQFIPIHPSRAEALAALDA